MRDLIREWAETKTLEEISSLTKQNVLDIIGNEDVSSLFLKKLKRIALNHKRLLLRQARENSLFETIKAALPNLENLDYDIGKSKDKFYMKLWLEGRPDGDSD